MMKKLGFPRMHKEKNEKRAFLPEFFGGLANLETDIYLEKGYGSKMGFVEDDYTKENPNIKFVSKEDAFNQDIVVVLRSPDFNEIELMKKGSILLSMLHYPTRAKRVRILKEKGIKAVSLDSLRDDLMQRIVFNAKGTSENGIELAFKELEKVRDDFYSKNRGPIEVSIMGMGLVGLGAARAAGRYACKELNEKMIEAGTKGVLVHMLPRNITGDRQEMSRILEKTDIFVDASSRDNPYDYIVDNKLLGRLKKDAIIVDLTADPYIVDEDGMQVKAIEGIPTGNLDKYVIYKEDKEYYDIPEEVDKENRRTVISCDAWPGVKPKECMELYGIQMLPIITKLFEKDVDDMGIESPYYFERAIYRATIEYFENHEKKK